MHFLQCPIDFALVVLCFAVMFSQFVVFEITVQMTDRYQLSFCRGSSATDLHTESNTNKSVISGNAPTAPVLVEASMPEQF